MRRMRFRGNGRAWDNDAQGRVPFRSYGDTPSLLSVIGGAASGVASGNVLQGLASIYNTLEIRTSVTPPAVVDLQSIATSTGPPNPVVEFLKPTIILTGNAGQDIIAPYGQAPDGTAGTIGIIAFMLGMGFAAGYWIRSRKGK